MSMQDHLLRFRLLSPADLETERLRLTALNSGFSSQAMGTKQYTIAVGQIMDQLNAIAFVQRERGGVVIPTPQENNWGEGITNFEMMS
jgi:hypothetical protein